MYKGLQVHEHVVASEMRPLHDELISRRSLEKKRTILLLTI